jgi:signal transduction histidine kinase
VIRTLILVLFFSIWAAPGRAQIHASREYVDISKINFADTISAITTKKFVSQDYLQKHRTLPAGFSNMGKVEYIPPERVQNVLLLQFNVSNSADSATRAMFFPGFFVTNIRLWKVKNDTLTLLRRSLPAVRDSIGFRAFSVGPRDSFTMVAEIHFEKTYTSGILPRIIGEENISRYISVMQNPPNNFNILSSIFCGLLLSMFLFSLANYVQEYAKEFLYYSVYALMLGLMLFSKQLFFLHYSHLSNMIESYLDFIMLTTAYIFYMVFLRMFLETKERHPFLHKLYQTSTVVLTIIILAFSYTHFFTNNYLPEYYIELTTKLYLLALTLTFLIYSVSKWDDSLLRYIFGGNLALFIFSLLSQLSISFVEQLADLPVFLRNSLIYYEMGLFLELLFFLMGLSYKNRRSLINRTRERERLKLENERKEFEKQLAVVQATQEERNRISADMHDELGSGVTAIRLMSEIVKTKMGRDNVLPEIEKISNSANELLSKMNAIIWTMTSSNDKLDNMVAYIRAYALEFFESTTIDCHFISNSDIPSTEISSEKRRNIFLCVKEALNNVAKHSKATDVWIAVSIEPRRLEIKITDNGAGINMARLREFGNGLSNMKKRMTSIDGAFVIQNNKGTEATLTAPL